MNPHNPQNLPICPHCNVRVALNHNGKCTHLGCGKRLDEQVVYQGNTKPKQRQLYFRFPATLTIQ